MQYDWILFDADETLFTFDAFEGLQRIFTPLGVSFSEQDYAEYQQTNKPLWQQYQNGEIDARQLQVARFTQWGQRVNIAPIELNTRFSVAMAQICQPFAGVLQTVKALSKKAKLGIITNGFQDMQQARLENTGLNDYFQFVVVSETLGVAKPDKAIFEYAFSLIENIDNKKINKQRVLMVGDNPTSDIQGGINAGIDTCWLKLGEQNYDSAITPTFSVRDWFELSALLMPAIELLPARN